MTAQLRDNNMQSNVVIIEPSSAGIKLIDASLNLNNKVFILTYNNEDRVIPKKYLDSCEIIEVDTNDETALAKKLEYLNYTTTINAIVPGFEYYVPSSARLNSIFKLKGLPIATADAMHFKDKMRIHLKACGVRMPGFIVAKSLDDLRKNADKITFPCVMKPTHLAGSLYIIKLHNMAELEYHFQRLLNDDFLDLGHTMQGNVIIEDYIDGKEYSVEGYVNNGQINFVSITDKYLSSEPHFIEIGHITKANTTPEIEKSLLEYTTAVVTALGINLGPFHCELRLSKNGPMLIEIASRLVGDNISEIIEIATGISLAENMINAYLGLPLENRNMSHFKQYAGVKFIYGCSGNFLNRIDGVEIINKMDGFHRFGLLTNPGELIAPFTDFRSRVAEIVFSGSSHKEVIDRLETSNNILKIMTGDA